MNLTNNQLRTIIKEELNKFLAEMSKEEEKFFGDEIKALVDNPDELYYVKKVKPRNPYVDLEERQFLNRRWIEDNVGKYLGGGSFRDAYQIKSHPDKILKISNRYMQHDPLDGQEYTTIAEDTNMLEIEMFNKYPGYFPKVYISDKEKQGIPRWLVIEKVKVIEYHTEFIRQLVRSFKSIPKSYNLVNDLIAEYFPSTSADFPPASGTGREIDAEQWAYVAWESVGFNDSNRLKDVLKDLPVWDEMYGDVLKRDVDNIIDEEILLDEAVRKVWKILTSDQYLVKFWDMVNDLHIEYNELRPGNVGTDLETGRKFLIIDISIFED
jgi:DNA-dependent RNA polymerase auxiliary subunit epsilon